MADVEDYLRRYPGSRDSLLFPGEDGHSNMHSSTLRKHYVRAREAAGLSHGLPTGPAAA